VVSSYCASAVQLHVNSKKPCCEWCKKSFESKECQQRWVPKSRLEEFSLIASSPARQGFQGGRTVPPRRSSMATILPPSSSIVEMENVAAAWMACLDYFSLTATTIGERAFSTVVVGRRQSTMAWAQRGRSVATPCRGTPQLPAKQGELLHIIWFICSSSLLKVVLNGKRTKCESIFKE